MLLVKQNVLKSYAKLLVAAITTMSAPAMAMGTQTRDILRMITSLVIVLGVIFFLAFIVKRLKITPTSQKNIRSVASLSIGPKERIVVVEVNNEQFMVGVTSHNVNLLHKLEKPIETANENSDNTSVPMTIQSLFKQGKL